MQQVRTDQVSSVPVQIRTHRIQPVAAALALFRLMRDPQDTGQVFRLTEALRGKSTKIMFQRFAASPMGIKILAERRSLLAALTDRAALAALPAGTLGRCYLDFMAEENLTAEGLVELAAQNIKTAPSSDDSVRLYAGRMRDMHDLYHVLTGYGRDELGEICVLAFSYPQQKIRSFKLISTLGTLNIWRRLRASGISPKGIGAAFREAAQNGRTAAWLPGEDLEAMLPMDLQALREQLKIPPPVMYDEVIARLRRETGTVSGPLALK
jgi:ubiquinone biosynthesis protein COQ4